MFRETHEQLLKFIDAVEKLGMEFELGCLIGFSMSLVCTGLGNILPETRYGPEFRTLGYWAMFGGLGLLGAGLTKRLFSRAPTSHV